MNIRASQIAISLLFIGLVGCAGPFSAFKIAQPAEPRNEKDVLVALAISRAVVSPRDVPDVDLLETSPGIIVRSDVSLISASGDTLADSITARSLPQDPSVRFIILSPGLLQKVADEHDDFVYLGVPEIRIGRDEALVVIATQWAVGKKSKVIIMSGGGYTLRFRKRGSEWRFDKILNGWIS